MSSSKAFTNPSGIAEVQLLMAKQREQFQKQIDEAGRRGVNLIQERTDRYMRRWKEALAHVADGADVLDIGAGWLPPRSSTC
jgi:hypothetical protein